MRYLDDLTAFNHALVYAFAPESPCNPIPATDPRYIIHFASQYDDVYQAYLYAQNEVLPVIQNQGVQGITSEKMLEWLHEIHKRIGATLAKDHQESGYPDLAAGKYIVTGQESMRWHATVVIEDPIIFCLSFEPTEAERETLNSKMIATAFKKIDVDQKELAAFFALLQKKYPIKSNKDKVDLNQGKNRLARLADDWQNEKLTEEEIAVCRKIVTFGMKAEKVAPAMKAYADRTLKALRECDRNNPEQVSALSGKAFFELTDIHPYFNANGRTATCWVNIILVALGYKSILVRLPNEKRDAKSTYTLAVKEMTEGKFKLFCAHIKSRMLEVMSGKEFRDEELKKLVTLRVEAKSFILQLQHEFPSFDLKTFCAGPLQSCVTQIGENYRTVDGAGSLNDAYICGMSEHNKLLAGKLQELRVSSKNESLKKAIAMLSDKVDWKLTEKNGLQLWHAFPLKEAAAIKEALSTYPHFTLQNRNITGDRENSVVIVSNINTDALINAANQKSEAAQAAQKSSASSTHN